jgi:rod shape-determining protein MreC
MNFRLRNKNFLVREKTRNSVIFPIIGVFFFILVFSMQWSRNLLFSIGSPLWTIKNSVSSFFETSIELLSSKINLLEENNLLKQQIQTKNQDQMLYGLLKKENQDLKNILNRNKTNEKLLLGTILVKPFLSAYDTLIIDVGSLDNVQINDKVLAQGNIYIGYISEVYDQTSKIVLYSSPGEKVKILIGDNNIEKEAVGQGGGNFKVEIPREIDVKEGDSIVMPSVSTNLFGIVERVEFKDSDSFQNILFKNPANISELKWVEVLLSNFKKK